MRRLPAAQPRSPGKIQTIMAATMATEIAAATVTNINTEAYVFTFLSRGIPDVVKKPFILTIVFT